MSADAGRGHDAGRRKKLAENDEGGLDRPGGNEMAIDVHIHCTGGEDGDEILRAMDEVGLERSVLFSPAPHASWDETEEGPGHQRAIDDIARIAAADLQRLIGFAWIEPTLPDAPEMVDYALGEKGLAGVKMIPDRWYPDDERAQVCYAKVGTYGRPMLFHSGILWSWGSTSKYCRPAGFEIMMDYPQTRFALAHMGWPWTDEAIAVADKLKNMQPRRDQECTCYLDITTGAPRAWKVDALRKVLGYFGDRYLVYGSDSHLPGGKDYAAVRLREDQEMLQEAGASEETIDRVMRTNALRWLGIE
jgi:predicted TIM-barrel fold metal-dependent hydrolase